MSKPKHQILDIYEQECHTSARVQNHSDRSTMQLKISESSCPRSMSPQELGVRGEEAATRFLKKRGYEILERNWSCFAGEADIVARIDGTLCFIEVKTRSQVEKGFPEEAVDARKRARYERIAAYYLQQYDATDIRVRFDVISILVLSENRAFLRFHTNAFGAEL